MIDLASSLRSSAPLGLALALALPAAAQTRSAPTGGLNTPRADHGSTVLDDDRVLLVGGSGLRSNAFRVGATLLDTAELYDPLTGRFTLASDLSGAAGRLPYGVARPTVARLADGRLLICGGLVLRFTREATRRAMVFDPRALTFREVGPMRRPRLGAAAARLPDGRVLVAGGRTRLLEVFDPATETFSLLRDMARPRAAARTRRGAFATTAHAVATPFGPRLLTLAGRFTNLLDVAGALACARFRPAALPRRPGAVIGLPDGRVLVAGQATIHVTNGTSPWTLTDRSPPRRRPPRPS